MKNKALNHQAEGDKRTSGGGASHPFRYFRFPAYPLSAFHQGILGRLILGAALAAGVVPGYAADEPAEAPTEEAKEAANEEPKEELTPEQMFEGGEGTPLNWVEVSYGGMMNSGNTGAAQQRLHQGEGMFGGIEDLHYQKQVNKDTLFSLDGRALLNSEDYRLALSLVNEKRGFLRFRFQQYRTWYDGSGGYYDPAALWLPAEDETLSIDRGEVGFVAGLTLKDLPKVTFEYVHQYRNGEKGSTAWGPANLGWYSGGFSGTRYISPSFYDIDEQRDIFKLDVQHQIKKTEVGVGARFETGTANNSRKMTFRPTEPTERKVTDSQNSRDNSFSAHAWSETWLKSNLMFSSGFLFANLDDNFSGSRVYGDDFDVINTPNAANGAGYVDLDGVLHKKEYVLNLNLMTIPTKNVTIIPSIRVQNQDWDSESTASPTSGASAPGAPVKSQSDGNALDIQERLDVRYTGLTNWVLYVRGEWMQGQGDLSETNGVSVGRKTDSERLFQKYSVGARWYPTRFATFDVGGYYKNNDYDYDNKFDNTSNAEASANRYPAYLVMQNFETLDGNFRVTLRPLKRVTCVSRYEYQVSTITTKPDSVSNLGETESSEMTSHIFAQNVSYVPWSRLSLQVGFNYVVSETRTGASEYEQETGTKAILNALNNYWTLNFNSTLVLDKKTDLSLGYFFYQSDNYSEGLVDGLALGSEVTQHGVTALLTRRLTEHLRLKLRYGYYHSDDYASGGNRDFESHVLFSSLQYRF